MKVADLLFGADWIFYVLFAVLAVYSVILISGHGGFLIAGYNTASKEEKAKYDEKKLCRVKGIGVLVIAVFVLLIVLFQNILPSFFVYIAVGIVFVDIFITNILKNTICKRGQNV